MTAFHVLSAAAVAFVIARAGVFAWLRRGRPGWVEFVSCPLCVGFWVGFGLGLARLSLSRSSGDPVVFWGLWQLRDALDLVAGGALVGATAFLYACVIDFLDALEQAAKRAFQAENRKLAAGHDVVGSGDPPKSVVEALAAAGRLGERDLRPQKPQGPDVVLVKEGDSWPEKPAERP